MPAAHEGVCRLVVTSAGVNAGFLLFPSFKTPQRVTLGLLARLRPRIIGNVFPDEQKVEK